MLKLCHRQGANLIRVMLDRESRTYNIEMFVNDQSPPEQENCSEITRRFVASPLLLDHKRYKFCRFHTTYTDDGLLGLDRPLP